MPYLVQEVHLIEFFIDPSSTAGHPTKADNLLIYPRRGPIEEMDHPAFFAATTGLLQNDIKRVIAYSTCSQMGYLFMAVGISQYSVALFHLVNHAFFKAVLFLAAGGVLHSMADQQDMRRLGGLISLLPFTYTIILIGSLSLMAIPFMTGFYSKDLILEKWGTQSEVVAAAVRDLERTQSKILEGAK